MNLVRCFFCASGIYDFILGLVCSVPYYGEHVYMLNLTRISDNGMKRREERI